MLNVSLGCLRIGSKITEKSRSGSGLSEFKSNDCKACDHVDLAFGTGETYNTARKVLVSQYFPSLHS